VQATTAGLLISKPAFVNVVVKFIYQITNDLGTNKNHHLEYVAFFIEY
jgi:hypothetical protein